MCKISQYSCKAVYEVLLCQQVWKLQPAKQNEQGNTSCQTMPLTELETQCTQQYSRFEAVQWMFGKQKGSVRSYLKQPQSISQYHLEKKKYSI